MTRTVLDINTLVSGIFWHGAPEAVLDEATFQTYTLLISTELIVELLDVLSRDKFATMRRKINKTADTLVSEIMAVSEIVTPGDVPDNVVRDPDDADVLACAVGGNADYIVSGDKDLLVLETYEGIPILSANQFLEILSQETE